jgi:hypothetical protein
LKCIRVPRLTTRCTGAAGNVHCEIRVVPRRPVNVSVRRGDLFAMNKRATSVAILSAIALVLIVTSQRPKMRGGKTVATAVVVTEAELESVAKELPFFLYMGTDAKHNIYCLRELGYFKCDRENASLNFPETSKLSFGMVKIGNWGNFVILNDGKFSVPDSQIVLNHIESFTPYLTDEP